MQTFNIICKVIFYGAMAFSGIVLLVGFFKRKKKLKNAHKQLEEDTKDENKE